MKYSCPQLGQIHSYPLAINSEIIFVSPDQAYYNEALGLPDGVDARLVVGSNAQ